MANDFSYHIDHHASLIPSESLVAARGARARGEIGDDDLRAVEDDAITTSLRRQKRMTLSAVSDGQLRRRNAVSVAFDAVPFVGPSLPGDGALRDLVGERFAPERRSLTSPVEIGERLTKSETDFLLAATHHPTLVSLPSPGYLGELCDGDAEGLSDIIRAEVAALAADGVAYVQLHNPVYAFLLTHAGGARAEDLGIDVDSMLARMLERDNAALDGLEAPGQFRVGLDLTTAGIAPLASGYHLDRVAGFLDTQGFRRLCVEHPAEEHARFPLELVSHGIVTSLGVVDVGVVAPEPVEELVERIDQVAELRDVDELAVATNGGLMFASGAMSEADQWVKLGLIEMVARYIWGNEL